MTHELFRIELAKELLKAATESQQSHTPLPHGPRHQPQQPLARLTECHFLGQFDKSANGRQIQCSCAVCSFKKGGGERRPHIIVNSVIYLCVLYPALSYITPRLTQQGTCSSMQGTLHIGVSYGISHCYNTPCITFMVPVHPSPLLTTLDVDVQSVYEHIIHPG